MGLRHPVCTLYIYSKALLQYTVGVCGCFVGLWVLTPFYVALFMGVGVPPSKVYVNPGIYPMCNSHRENIP